ncbi:MAG: HAD family hydrolase [Dehalococcoidia bacterium]
MPATQLRAVFFDIGDTLWHAQAAPPASAFREMAAGRATAFLAANGFTTDGAADLARIAWDSLEEAMRVARAADLAEPDYGARAGAALRSAGIHIDDATASRFLDAIYVSGVDGGKQAYRDAAPVLSELKRRGFLIGSITNRAFGGIRFRDDLRAAGIDGVWDSHTVSVEVGYLKPHPAVFQHALASLSVRAGESLMIGNSLREDIAGAARLGFKTAWKRSVPDAEDVEPDYVFDDLSELLALSALRSAA